MAKAFTTEAERDEYEKQRETQINAMDKTSQEWNTGWCAFKRAMNSKRNPPPAEVYDQFKTAIESNNTSEKHKLFRSFFITSGNYGRMQIFMTLTREKTIKCAETEKGRRRWHNLNYSELMPTRSTLLAM